MSAVIQLTTEERTALIARHPDYFRRDWIGTLKITLVVTVLLGLLGLGIALLEISPEKIWEGFGKLGRIVTIMMPPEYGTTERLMAWIKAMGETLAIAFLGTLIAAVIAFPLGFMAARNVMPVWLARFTLRRTFDSMRAIDQLIWALIWINVVGLGPFAGILAIMTSDVGAFGKLFSEAIEAADKKEREGVISSGGSTVQGIRYGLMPQVLPVILSQVLYFLESNTRSSTIIGVVGAGGIGLTLYEAIQTYEWQRVSFIILMILVVVAVLDFMSENLRRRLIK